MSFRHARIDDRLPRRMWTLRKGREAEMGPSTGDS